MEAVLIGASFSGGAVLPEALGSLLSWKETPAMVSDSGGGLESSKEKSILFSLLTTVEQRDKETVQSSSKKNSQQSL